MKLKECERTAFREGEGLPEADHCPLQDKPQASMEQVDLNRAHCHL